jgi:hypothetical protein
MNAQFAFVNSGSLNRYQTFSNEVMNRIIDNPINTNVIPIEMESHNCLYNFTQEWFSLNNDMVKIHIKVHNEPENGFIQIAGIIYCAYQFEEFVYRKNKSLFTNNIDRINIAVDNFFNIVQTRLRVFTPVIDDTFLQQIIQQLIQTYNEWRTPLSNVDPNSHWRGIPGIPSRTPVANISRVPSPTPVEEEVVEPDWDTNTNMPRPNIVINPRVQHPRVDLMRSNQLNIIPTIIEELKITTINYCLICASESEQKGFRMTCCNQDNTVCSKCIIKHQVLEKTKYCSMLEIVDLKMFNDKQNCFFCRHPNLYNDIKNDKDCKKQFIEFVQNKALEELCEKQERHLNNLYRNVSL